MRAFKCVRLRKMASTSSSIRSIFDKSSFSRCWKQSNTLKSLSSTLASMSKEIERNCGYISANFAGNWLEKYSVCRNLMPSFHSLQTWELWDLELAGDLSRIFFNMSGESALNGDGDVCFALTMCEGGFHECFTGLCINVSKVRDRLCKRQFQALWKQLARWAKMRLDILDMLCCNLRASWQRRIILAFEPRSQALRRCMRWWGREKNTALSLKHDFQYAHGESFIQFKLKDLVF